MRNSKGFGLIEVLVASVVLVSLLAAVLPLFDAGQNQLAKAEKVAVMLSAKKRIYHRIAEVNPAEQSSGKGHDGHWEYRWQARRISDFRQQHSREALVRYQVALYQINVSIYPKESQQALDQFRFKHLGWKK